MLMLKFLLDQSHSGDVRFYPTTHLMATSYYTTRDSHNDELVHPQCVTPQYRSSIRGLERYAFQYMVLRESIANKV